MQKYAIFIDGTWTWNNKLINLDDPIITTQSSRSILLNNSNGTVSNLYFAIRVEPLTYENLTKLYRLELLCYFAQKRPVLSSSNIYKSWFSNYCKFCPELQSSTHYFEFDRRNIHLCDKCTSIIYNIHKTSEYKTSLFINKFKLEDHLSIDAIIYCNNGKLQFLCTNILNINELYYPNLLKLRHQVVTCYHKTLGSNEICESCEICKVCKANITFMNICKYCLAYSYKLFVNDGTIKSLLITELLIMHTDGIVQYDIINYIMKMVLKLSGL